MPVGSGRRSGREGVSVLKYERWEVAPPHPEARAALEQGGITPLLAAVMAARGVQTPEEARRLINPAKEPLLDPLLMKDMDLAVARIRKAISHRELMAVYGDYDVDGITATCLLTQSFRDMGGRITSYIPGRLAEGYGLNQDAVRNLRGRGVRLLITVDCGITAIEETEWANALGMDVIITDHHACKNELPPALAVLDPHRPDCPYPFKGLAGVGVALKLAMAVAGPSKAAAVFRNCRDLAALGTVADVMPMTGENRCIVSQGLKDLNPPRRLGLARLLQYAGMNNRPITSISIGYTLAPRINAAGRMGQASIAEELILTDDPDQASELAMVLIQLNTERQVVEGAIYDQCVNLLKREPQEGVIILAGRSWHQGVVGIVASRLAERYNCPAFMICLEHGTGRGSCRAWGGTNLFELLDSCRDLLESYGGHALAAGFTVKEENLPALMHAVRARVNDAGGQQEQVLHADAVVDARELTPSAVQELDLLEPFGTGNPRPVLMIQGAQVQTVSRVGQGRHIKLHLDVRGSTQEAMWFSAGEPDGKLIPGCRVDVAFTPQINDFRGSRFVQLHVTDLKIAPTRAALEQSIYDRFVQGDYLTPQEAGFLLPSRQDFVVLWRWLVSQSVGGTMVEGNLHRITKGVSRRTHHREAPVRTMLCLEVLEERGLISLNRRTDRLQITLCGWEHKVDLEASEIMIRLRRALEGGGR